MADLIVIPARFGSQRLPGKPLLEIAGQSLLSRVIHIARVAQREFDNVEIVVATDDDRIKEHAESLGCEAVMTDSSINSGSSRALAAANSRAVRPEVIVNLQGDAPFIPPAVVKQMLKVSRTTEGVVTSVSVLSWKQLDMLREHKKVAPFSGTTCVREPNGRALWFSKSIIPAIRGEEDLRMQGGMSPVLRHLGLYAYRYAALAAFDAAPCSFYEELEGLEQLRFFALGISVTTVEIDAPRISMSGIDTAQDIRLAEQLILEFGDPMEQEN